MKLGAEAGRPGYLLNSPRGTPGAFCEVENRWGPGDVLAVGPVCSRACSHTTMPAGPGRALCHFVFGLGGDSLSTLLQRLQQGGQGGGSRFRVLSGSSGGPRDAFSATGNGSHWRHLGLPTAVAHSGISAVKSWASVRDLAEASWSTGEAMVILRAWEALLPIPRWEQKGKADPSCFLEPKVTALLCHSEWPAVPTLRSSGLGRQCCYLRGCLSSNRPVPPLTTFPTTRQAEGDFSSSWDPVKDRRACVGV